MHVKYCTWQPLNHKNKWRVNVHSQMGEPGDKANKLLHSLLMHPRMCWFSTCSNRECCCYGVLHSASVRGSSAVTPCGMMVIGGGGEGE